LLTQQWEKRRQVGISHSNVQTAISKTRIFAVGGRLHPTQEVVGDTAKYDSAELATPQSRQHKIWKQSSFMSFNAASDFAVWAMPQNRTHQRVTVLLIERIPVNEKKTYYVTGTSHGLSICIQK
jgi:hypothetical protein